MTVQALRKILEELERQNLGDFEIELSEPFFDAHGPIIDRHDFIFESDILNDIGYSDRKVLLGIEREN